jgi:two-component system, OmpR family, sensor kinase
MSLRLRLTILYSTLTGGILLVFGMLIFLLVNILLVNQVDTILLDTARDALPRIRVDVGGQLMLIELPRMDMTANVVIQVLDVTGNIEYASAPLRSLETAVDPVAAQAASQAFSDTYIGSIHLRVLTVPLFAGGRRIGLLQAAYNTGIADATRKTLLQVIVITALASMMLAAAASWLTIARALSPLAAVTSTAQQISSADDLSWRIPLHGPENDEVGRLVLAFNATLERLEHIFTSQQRFLADVSHELRTPLTVIKGNVDLMRKMGCTDDESLAGIEDEADRLTRLVSNLLLETQADSGKLPLHFAPLELDTLLLEVFKEMRVLARDRVRLKVTEIDQVLVNGDRDRLAQVLINLVSNAIKYTPQGGEVFLSLAKVGANARIIVRDTGMGISKEDLPHIFERFYRAEKSRSRSISGGFGLGLSIANWIVTHHDGHIEVDSTEGKGTSFVIYLPLLEPEGLKPGG